ncbi:MAG: UDP-2,3-diacylglucosamine diphosphatase LpxI [Candidatus Ancaeobacter aquaticus]|nr:UDP-2,3-diacylglucosamine diphosphatase LpxI [Candidatus Ancaeobacter aquaticus]
METLGLIAGWGQLPFMVIDGARARGVSKICAVGFHGHTDPEIEEKVDQFKWIGVGQLNTMIRFFKDASASRAVMAGKLKHTLIFSNIKFDLRMIGMVAKLKDRRADSILGAIADELEKDGITLLELPPWLGTGMPDKGVLTKTIPTKSQQEDIDFGYTIAKGISGLDIGQTVVVKDKAVLAVEAFEGTDETLVRGGHYGKKHSVAIKVAKPSQDMRFDVPVIGVETIEVLKKAKIDCCAIEAQKTILIDKEKIMQAADSAKIALVAI